MTHNMTGGAPPASKTAAPGKRTVFTGLVSCPLFSEQAKLTLEKDGLLIAATFDQLPIPYGEITAFALTDYRVEIQTRDGLVTVSHLGQAARWLYDRLYAAYNDAVLAALLVEGKHGFEAQGEYIAEENGKTRQGAAILRLYEDCLCLLPPDQHARRVPLCFLSGMEKSDYSLTLTLSSGERYTLLKLGGELDNLERLLTDGLRALRERTLSWLRELAPNLGSMQAAMAAKLAPLGTAASLAELSAAAPPLASALEQKIGDSRMAQTYPWLRDLCAGDGLFVGALPPPKKQEAEQPAPGVPPGRATPPRGAIPMEQPAEETGPEEPKPVLWVIAPDRDRRMAAVELALPQDEAAATYLYRAESEWEPFARLISRALEATGFRREVILLPGEALNTPEHLADAMLARRTPALALLRSRFAGRAVHSSPDRWRRDIENCRAAIPPEGRPQTPKLKQKFCTNCGAALDPDIKFCGQCGSQQ